MKIKKTRIVEEEVETTMEELVEEFFEKGVNINYYDTIEEVLEELYWYLDNQKINVSAEEKILLENAVEKSFNERCLINKQLEVDKLQNRKNIIDFLENLLCLDEWSEKGDVGFLLSAEEIVDLIIENGNK